MAVAVIVFSSTGYFVAFGASPMDSKSDTLINSSGGDVSNFVTDTLAVRALYYVPPRDSRK